MNFTELDHLTGQEQIRNQDIGEAHCRTTKVRTV